MRGLLRPLFAGGLSIAIAGTTLLASSSAVFAATEPTFTTLSVNTPVDEGDKPTVTGTFDDLDAADQHTVQINWGDASIDLYTLPVGARTFSLQKSVGYPDNFPDLLIQVMLSDGSFSVSEFRHIAVLNVAPSVTSFVLSSTELDAGQTVTATGVFTDPGVADTHPVRIDWGDRSAATTLNLARRVPTFTTSAHTYTAGGTFTVTATIADDDGGSVDATSSVTVHGTNQPPTVVSFGVAAGSEGGSSSLSLTFADTEASDTHTVSVAWGDGSTTAPVVLASNVTSYATTHVYADTGTYEVVLTLDDNAGNSVTASASVSPTNVAPTVGGLALSPAAVVDHQTFTLTGDFTDPGTADTFTLTVTWGDGTSSTEPLAAGVRGFSASHDYAEVGTYLVTPTVTDRDDGTGSKSTSVVVRARNTGPSALALSPTVTGSTVVVGASFADPDALDTHTVTMSWGDGTTTLSLAAGATIFNATHAYVSSGTYTVSATVADPSGASANASVQVVVTVSAGSSALDLLDQMASLIRGLDLNRNVERWLIRQIDELKASLATGNTAVCADLKAFGKLSPFVRRLLPSDEYAALSALAAKLEIAAQCPSTNHHGNEQEDRDR